jgi:hypothetical protein
MICATLTGKLVTPPQARAVGEDAGKLETMNRPDGKLSGLYEVTPEQVCASVVYVDSRQSNIHVDPLCKELLT